MNPSEPENPVTNPPATDLPEVERGDMRIGFYNVENLFDTIDDPGNSQDDEFLPGSSKNWNAERYQQKISDIGEVFRALDYPVLMGLSEVENRGVLQDLVDSEKLRDAGYGIVHEDSPDFRGIDVALLYRKAEFSVADFTAIEVELPPSVSEFSTTRDILQVRGTLRNEEVFLFVNHWPSRSGGVSATSGKREFAAGVLRSAIDEILLNNPDANIIALGDFNDEPYNRSLTDALQVQTQKPVMPDNQLYNCTIPFLEAGAGSYMYQGEWQMYDQLVVSGRLLDTSGTLKILSFDILMEDFLLFDHPEDGPRPNRTYGGDNYYGGISDHLPVFLEVAIQP